MPLGGVVRHLLGLLGLRGPDVGHGDVPAGSGGGSISVSVGGPVVVGGLQELGGGDESLSLQRGETFSIWG